MLRRSNIDQYEKSQMLSARHARDLGSRTSPVGQKVRDAFHGGTLSLGQGDTAILLSRE